MEEEKIPERLSKGVSTISLNGEGKKEEKFLLLERLDVYESVLGDPNSKTTPHIDCFPPPFQSVPCNPIVLDIAYNYIEFPSLENRMKKDKKGLFSRLWRQMTIGFGTEWKRLSPRSLRFNFISSSA